MITITQNNDCLRKRRVVASRVIAANVAHNIQDDGNRYEFLMLNLQQSFSFWMIICLFSFFFFANTSTMLALYIRSPGAKTFDRVYPIGFSRNYYQKTLWRIWWWINRIRTCPVLHNKYMKSRNMARRHGTWNYALPFDHISFIAKFKMCSRFDTKECCMFNSFIFTGIFTNQAGTTTHNSTNSQKLIWKVIQNS